mmetsp:Transcript_12552/g.19748  ORF Transcript_12552/g.19748 Transcript_12552/m.19748 type:complete len:285 (-) Transcript_12552:551-1405(-)
MSRAQVLLLLGLLALSILTPALAEKTKKKKTSLTASKLSKYVQCEVCQALGTNLYEQGMNLIKDKGGRKKAGEEPVLELLEDICSEGTPQGEWINTLDIVGTKGALKLELQDGFRECKDNECKTIVKVCEDVKTEAGESDIAEKLYRGHYTSSAETFADALCTKMTETCKGTTPELKNARIDDPFTALDKQEWDALKLQKSMGSMGIKGQMYNRDSMKDMLQDQVDDAKESMFEEMKKQKEEQQKEDAGFMWYTHQELQSWARNGTCSQTTGVQSRSFQTYSAT